ncbi:MAG: glycoside hydrolase family 31 protein [bacterium]
MRYEEQILKLHDYTIVFLSDTCLVVTKDIEQTLSYEKMRPSNDIKKTKNSIGTTTFYVQSKSRTAHLYINEKKYSLDVLIKRAPKFEDVNLKSINKYITYRKGDSYFVAIPYEDYTYLNRNNVLLKSQLGNKIYFKRLNREEVIEKQKALFKLNVPITNIITDTKVLEQNDIIEIKTIVANDVSQNNDSYFLTEHLIKIMNTGAKQVLTYGFSRNNTLNYFDINMSNNFEELKQYLDCDLNYNKNYFNLKHTSEVTKNYSCRLIQFNTFLPVMLLEYDKIKDLLDDQDTANILAKYCTLRHRLIPYLYSAFKKKRLYLEDVYKKVDNKLYVADQILISPIYTELDKTLQQNGIPIALDDIYYDLETLEKYEVGTIHNFYSLDTMPLFARAGAIIPLLVLNSNEYEMFVFPNSKNEYVLHYDDYVVDEFVRHAYTTFKLEYSHTKMVLKITPTSPKELLPSIFYMNFINIKKNSKVKINNEEYQNDYNNDKKYLIIKLEDTTKEIEIEITNTFGLEIDRRNEFLDKKLKKFFNNIDCDEKDKSFYKYKIRPYLHEGIDNVVSRINKQNKLLTKKQKKYLNKMLEMYNK